MELSLIWHAMTLMQRHCNVFGQIMNHVRVCVCYLGQNQCKQQLPSAVIWTDFHLLWNLPRITIFDGRSLKIDMASHEKNILPLSSRLSPPFWSWHCWQRVGYFRFCQNIPGKNQKQILKSALFYSVLRITIQIIEIIKSYFCLLIRHPIAYFLLSFSVC